MVFRVLKQNAVRSSFVAAFLYSIYAIKHQASYGRNGNVGIDFSRSEEAEYNYEQEPLKEITSLDFSLSKSLKKRCEHSTKHVHSLSELSSTQKEIVFKHLIVSDKFKFIYCYVPKVACSNWKKTYLLMHGYIKSITDVPHLDHTKGFKRLSDYGEKEIQHRLKSYFKFAFVRHPMERALSAYRNKFGEIKSFYSKTGKRIAEMYHKPKETYPGKVPGDDVTFVDFLRYVTDSGFPPSYLDEHFMPMHLQCQPCAIKYDYIGTYDNIVKSSELVLRHVNAPKDVHFPQQQSWYRPTSDYVLHYYYSLVPPIIIDRFKKAYRHDFEMFEFEQNNLTYLA